MDKAMEYINKLYIFLPNQVSEISLTEAAICATIIAVVFLIMLYIKSLITDEEVSVPIYVSAVAFIGILLGRLVRVFDPGLGVSIQIACTQIFTWCVLFDYFYYTLRYIPLYFLKGVFGFGGLAFIMYFVGLANLGEIFILLVIASILGQMAAIFFNKD